MVAMESYEQFEHDDQMKWRVARPKSMQISRENNSQTISSSSGFPRLVWLRLIVVVAVAVRHNSNATSYSPAIAPASRTSLIMTAAPTSALSPPSCTVCVNGNDELYVNQSKAFSIPGLLTQTCGDLLQTVGLFQNDSPACSSIQTLGTFCGCPTSKKACTLCPGFSNSMLALFALDEVPAEASQYNIFGAPPGTTLNCETLNSAIHVLATSNDTLCRQTQKGYGECCGFTAPVGGGAHPRPVRTKPCNVCLDGGNITLPNRTIELGALPVRNCSQLDTLAYTFAANDTQCGNVQLLGPYCGCPVTMQACSFCPNGEPVPFPNRPFPLLASFQGLPPGFLRKVAGDLTCGEYQSILEVDSSSNIGIDSGYACLVGQFRSAECGCTQGYQEELVTWLFRVSAMLSLIGSFFIVRDVMKKPPERRTTYHQLILGTTCFDVITSTAYLLSGLLLPGPGYEAHGTHGTCVLQGILIQLGLTSLFYSVLLSIYYLLLIKYNWKESRFRKYRKYFHFPIIIIGVALTAAASTSIASQLGFCYVAIPPEAASRLRITLLFVVPSSLALVTIFACTFLTCYHVYSTERTTLKWSAKRNLSMTKKVCLQSFLYFVGFAVTIPCVMLNYYGDFRTNNHFGAFAAAAFFAPAQGFLNSLVYFHRASKGSQWNWIDLCGYCRRKGKSESKPPPTEDHPSAAPGHGGAVEVCETSQDQPSKTTDATCSSSNEENRQNCTPTNVTDSSVPTDSPRESERESQESESDPFSAAAAHWLMETFDHSDENTQPATPRPFANSIAVGRSFFRSSLVPHRQSMV